MKVLSDLEISMVSGGTGPDFTNVVTTVTSTEDEAASTFERIMRLIAIRNAIK